jgi:hypothetical protein
MAVWIGQLCSCHLNAAQLLLPGLYLQLLAELQSLPIILIASISLNLCRIGYGAKVTHGMS